MTTEKDPRGRGIDSPLFSIREPDESRQAQVIDAIASGEFFGWTVGEVGFQLYLAWPGYFGGDEDTYVHVAADAPHYLVTALLEHEAVNLVIEVAA